MNRCQTEDTEKSPTDGGAQNAPHFACCHIPLQSPFLYATHSEELVASKGSH